VQARDHFKIEFELVLALAAPQREQLLQQLVQRLQAGAELAAGVRQKLLGQAWADKAAEELAMAATGVDLSRPRDDAFTHLLQTVLVGVTTHWSPSMRPRWVSSKLCPGCSSASVGAGNQ
jgi:hypothetical protein